MSVNVDINVKKQNEKLATATTKFTLFQSKTYKRLRSIFKYLELLSSVTVDSCPNSSEDETECDCHNNKNNINIEVVRCEGFDEIYGAFKLQFNSALGLREIEVAHNGIGFPSFEYTLSYADYAGAMVFKVLANANEFTVTPLLGEDYLTGHEIDLAILEVEEYLKNTYGDYAELKRLRALKEAELANLHKIELDDLENGSKSK